MKKLKPIPIEKIVYTYNCPICSMQLLETYTSEGMTSRYRCACGYLYTDSHDNGISIHMPGEDDE